VRGVHIDTAVAAIRGLVSTGHAARIEHRCRARGPEH
jgi:hypothetical protein